MDKKWNTALIVDLHGFTQMCELDECGLIAQFVRDIFDGSVRQVEGGNGIVANTIGDAILCLFTNPNDALLASFGIIHDFWKTHDYIVGPDKLESEDWEFVRKGIFCRCAFEKGDIQSAILGTDTGDFNMYAGIPINYAQRIINFPEKKYDTVDWQRNTLIVGRNAYEELKNGYEFESPIEKKVKRVRYIGYPFDTRMMWGD